MVRGTRLAEPGRAVSPEIGSLLVTRITWEAQDIVSIRLEPADGGELPEWEPGAHIELELPSGLVRQYSLCGDPADRSSWTIAVLRERDGRGGSAELHDLALVGRSLRVRSLRNHFALVDGSRYLLIGGGIGITPMVAMARRLARGGRDWRLIYTARSRSRMAFVNDLCGLGDEVVVRSSDADGPLDVGALIESTPTDTVVYCCGPEGLMTAVRGACEDAVPPREFHMERFAAPGSGTSAPAAREAAETFTVTLQSTGVELSVPPERTVLDVVRDVLPNVPYSCEEGYCGSCETRVLLGIPEHRDDVLSDAERGANDTMMICISRAKSANLLLDL